MSSLNQQTFTHISIPQLKAMFSDDGNYQQLAPKYRRLISAGNVSLIVEMFMEMHRILTNQKQSPYSKLLVMRFIRDCIGKAEYCFLTLLNSLIAPVIMEVALYRKESRDDHRGQHFFRDYAGPQQTASDLLLIGLSYLKIILETYATVSCLSSCPFNQSLDFHIPSRIAQQYKTLTAINVKFPDQHTYYKLMNSDRILRNYQNKFKQSSQNISNFYDYLISQLLYSEHFDVYADIFVAVIRSGDRHCVRIVTELISKQLQAQKQDDYEFKFDYMVLTDKLFVSGDIEMIKNIKDELLVLILENLLRKKLPYHNKHYLWIWGYLAERQKIEHCQSLISISHSLLTCEITVDNILRDKAIDMQAVCERFHRSYSEQKRSNELKLSQMPNIKQSQQRMMAKIMKLLIDLRKINKKPMQRERSKSSDNQVSVTPSEQSKKQQTFMNIIRDEMQSKILDAEESVIRMKEESEQICQSNHNTPITSSTALRYRGASPHEEQSSSIFTPKHSIKSRNKRKGISLSKTFNQCFSSFNGSEGSALKQYQTKTFQTLTEKKGQKYPQQTLKKMNRQVRDSQRNRQSNNQIQQSQYQTPTKRIVHSSARSVRKLTETQPNDYYQHFSNNSINLKSRAHFISTNRLFDYLPVKLKKSILKQKCLVMKNADIEIGLITHPQVEQGIIQANIYVTTFFSTSNIRIEVINPEWLEPKRSVHETETAYKQTQYFATFPLTVNFNLNQLSYSRRPRITVTYTSHSTCMTQNLRSELPIFITNSAENPKLQSQGLQGMLKQMQQISSYIDIDTKVVKGYEDYRRYFQNAVILSSPRTYCARLKLPNSAEYYIVLSFVERNQGQLKFIEAKKGENQQFNEIVFQGFYSLIGV